MLTGSPAPCPGLRLVLARAPEEDVLWRKARQLATRRGQFCKKRGLPAVAPSTERGCLMCAHSPAFYQLSKSDSQNRD